MSTGGQLPEAGGQLDLCTQHRAIGGEGAGETGSVVRMNRTSLGAGMKGGDQEQEQGGYILEGVVALPRKLPQDGSQCV